MTTGSEVGKFKVRIVNHLSVSQDPIGEPIIREYDSGVAALRDLDFSIDHDDFGNGPEAGSRVFRSHSLVLPDGRCLAFNDAYTAIFGELPIREDDGTYSYPRLERKKTRAKKERG